MRQGGRIWASAAALFALIGLLGSTATAEDKVPPKPTLFSGYFDDYLMVAANADARMLSGYYDDGKCRFAFRGPLVPTELYQRRDFGEAYMVDSWDPAFPARRFTTEIYSRAIGGYQTQITLEPGQRDPNRPRACRWRISLDRAGNVSNSFVAVRVVRTPQAKLVNITGVITTPRGKVPRIVASRTRPPKVGTGVWVNQTYSRVYSPRGLVYLNWYDPSGTVHGGYIRERDLYPLPKDPPPEE